MHNGTPLVADEVTITIDKTAGLPDKLFQRDLRRAALFERKLYPTSPSFTLGHWNGILMATNLIQALHGELNNIGELGRFFVKPTYYVKGSPPTDVIGIDPINPPDDPVFGVGVVDEPVVI